MPYLRCLACGLLAHVITADAAPIRCSRCWALDREVQLVPIEESLRYVERPHADKPGALPPRRKGGA